ncbi:hypothetical protein OUZ56_025144 [Daphnia magna]|uniref:Uncharacterized protein n=1 Tax=Daphnia magna TaxID=35525 RepID=A0ABQ9ZKD3_9CRUS|nr:hypothetical protein OUZ56_025144 [Daphnia magna]
MKRMLASNGIPRSFYTLCPLIISSYTCLRFARRPVFASPVAPSSLRPSPHLHTARRLVFASWSPPLHFAPSSPRLCGSGSAVLPNGLYAMGGTVAQAVWLKVDRRGNAPVGTTLLSMWWCLPGELGWESNP